jgi:D-inositol-3-phosphate glycosyltransferase
MNWKKTMNLKPKKLKTVTIVSYTYPYIGSGIGNVALSQSEALAELGHQVTLISSNFPKTKQKFIKKNVTHLKLAGLDLLEKISIPVPFFLFNKKAVKAIKDSDVVHIHDFFYPSSLFGLILGKYHLKKVVLTVHILGIKYQNPAVNLLQKLAINTLGTFILRNSDTILVINQNFIKDRLLVDYQDKTHYLQNGVDLTTFKPVSNQVKLALREKHALPKDKKIALFVGRFVPKKGFDLLLKLKPKDYLLLCIGDAKNNQPKNLSGNILIMGQKNPEEIKEYYLLSDLFVLPSFGEGFPLSVQEAMACGLPILVGQNNSYINSLDKKYVELLDYSPESIEKSIIETISNKTRLKQMKNYSIKFSQNFFDWNKNAQYLSEVYQQSGGKA